MTSDSPTRPILKSQREIRRYPTRCLNLAHFNASNSIVDRHKSGCRRIIRTVRPSLPSPHCPFHRRNSRYTPNRTDARHSVPKSRHTASRRP